MIGLAVSVATFCAVFGEFLGLCDQRIELLAQICAGEFDHLRIRLGGNVISRYQIEGSVAVGAGRFDNLEAVAGAAF